MIIVDGNICAGMRCYDCQRREGRPECGFKGIKPGRRPLALNLDTGWRVTHPAGQFLFKRQAVCKRAKADSLHYPLDRVLPPVNQRCVPALSHWYHASMPAPLVADTSKMVMPGLTRRAYSLHFSISKSRCGNRSVLLSSITVEL